MNSAFEHLKDARDREHGRVQTRHGLVAASPLCFVVDDVSTSQFIASVMSNLGVRTEHFRQFGGMLNIAANRRPDVLFLDLGAAGLGSEAAISALGASNIRCPVQLTTGLNAVLVEETRRIGERRGLTMLPVLHKPFRESSIRRIAHDLGLRRDAVSGIPVSLRQALKNGWLELWYQPKIDLRAMMLTGAEAYTRVRHPDHGVLPPESLLLNAGEGDLLLLTQHVLQTAMRDWQSFAGFGAPIRFSVNVPSCALTELPLATLIREERPKHGHWPGLILELHEDEIIQDLSLASSVARALKPLNVSLALDDFGPGYATLAKLKRQPFCELKIDRSFITNCGEDDRSAGLCETVVELAHRFGIHAVAEGVETLSELRALTRMDCDIGQGYLFARPMPKEQFAALLRERGKVRPIR